MQHSTIAQWVEVAKKVFRVGASKHANNPEARSTMIAGENLKRVASYMMKLHDELCLEEFLPAGMQCFKAHCAHVCLLCGAITDAIVAIHLTGSLCFEHGHVIILPTWVQPSRSGMV